MEKRFKDTVKSLMAQQSWWVMATHEPTRRGVPDLSAVVKGRATWLELKYCCKEITEGDTVSLQHELTAPQSKMLRDLSQAGALSGVLIGYENRMCTFIPAEKLTPGPMKKFTANSVIPIDDFIAWLDTQATDGLTSTAQ